MPLNRPPRFVISGGGTGGHVFPAIAIADELRRLHPTAEFLFVGAKGRMEMEKVPAAGYRIEGLWISGLQRSFTLDNLSFPVKVLSSLFRSRTLLREFRPDVVIGTGGYAGAPILYAAARMGIPTLIQEPNAFAGLANKWLGRRVDKICVAFGGMAKFFPAHKLIITGNPVREQLLDRAREMNVDGPPTVFLMGGSGGARSLNEAMAGSTELIRARPQVQWLWQCGKHYLADYADCATAQLPNVTLTAFVDKMDEAYARATVVIGRAGSTTIAEIEYLGKPAILVPSPWVAEDHQTKNAEALTQSGAALLVPDHRVGEELVPEALALVDDAERRETLGRNARAQAKPGAVHRIATEALNLISPTTNKNSVHAAV
ncbi:UDP-N-acetylglucosamine--N-acetylmuramyl-(pentapeptide) pyrophosphoryl-undecaprenol N-acetylglucosamine transferase [Lewinella marina]|uniref:UDP-N-acetylglucosamine--N-acetylmuramyl-(pentapeptide) pyrophosphoryl-undecaprenol N-acetylglucosamine transferase n=1 Tax=Neolewinella marina TaxID=438751 RepID=A0A2G0CIZ5_9BACT|nr:undecaprenyldiphospho-muramoylpentapeptide beta-N-acetylglucosaminyltransferase [Neolewinella marina]NJB84908.1 UDP-N-acetylglucosamine--N-acetylmuramyl-(pentapeptide) pyrophosphoryl-undecaprenol N-acetylglucosamine transferase [Neolewinella marina]PHK99939.1 undecaprenyldiphospho-muramoylpentapeptide beta-N-acetylglucosaminyltransferase [Neolewinella marina]